MRILKTAVTCFLLIAILASQGLCYADEIKEYTVDLSKYTAEDNSQMTDGQLILNNGSKAEYNVFFPFNAAKMVITYSGTGNLKLNVNDDEFVCVCNGNNAETEANFVRVKRSGDYKVVISADSYIAIQKIKFVKEKLDTPPREPFDLKFSDYESALQTAVVLSPKSSVMMVNGSRRYTDFNDYKVTPVVQNGKTYLPIHALARVLGYYYESIPDKNYFLLREDNREYYFINGDTKRRISEDTPETIENKHIMINGDYWLELRYFAEEIGKYVGYRDGYIAIDLRKYVSDILNNEEIFSMVKEEMEAYQPVADSGNTYYVAQTPSASDENDGSLSAPFLSLKKAAETAKAGDTVIIREGVYREVLEPKNNGTASKPITFKAKDGEKVTISANEPISIFADYKDGMVIANMDWTLGQGRDMLFIDGEAVPEARHPNTHTAERKETREYTSPFFMTRGNIRLSVDNEKLALSDTDLDQPDNYWKGAIYVTLSGWGWYPTTAKITSSEKGKLYLGETTKTMWFPTNEGYRKTDCGYITCTKNAIDVPGEWAVEDGRLYMIPPEGKTAKTLKVEMKKRQLVMNLENSSYIHIKNINTIGGSAKLNNSVMCILDGVNMKNIAHYTFTANQLYNTFDGIPPTDPNNAPMRGEDGVYIGGRDNVFINGSIDGSAGNSLTLTGLYTYVENNDFKDCGYIARGGLGIFGNALQKTEDLTGGHFIYQNSSHGANRSVFTGSTYEDWYSRYGKVPSRLPMEVAYNDFYNANFAARDTGILYYHGAVIGSDRLYSKVHHNYAHDGGTVDGANSSYYFDNLMQFFECYDNIAYSTIKEVPKTELPYVQDPGYFPESHAFGYAYNNNSLDYLAGGAKDLTYEDFPGGRPFDAGVYDGEYLANYERLMKNEEADYLYLRNAKVENGAKIVSGNVVFSDNNQTAVLENVDFGDGKNMLDFYFNGDYSYTDDKYTIAIGTDLETAHKYTLNTKTLSRSETGLNKNTLFLNKKSYKGKQNIYITSQAWKSSSLIKIGIGYKDNLDSSIVTQIYAGNCDALTSTWAQRMYVEGPDGLDGKNHPCIYLANKGTMLEYKNVSVFEDCNEFVINSASPRAVLGSIVQLRKDSPDGEILGEITVTDAVLGEGENQGFKDMRVPLKETLKAGNYDFYLTFTGPDHTWTRIYWFALANTAAEVLK